MLGFRRRINLFSLLGFRIQADPSWLIIASLIAWSLAVGLFPLFYPGRSPAIYWTMGISGSLGLFVSIIIHELSHAVVGKRYGMETEGITLWLFGGIAEMTKDADRPLTEFLMAGAGPLSSFALAAFLYLVFILGGAAALPIALLGVIQYLVWLNIILAVFNLLPAFPLDGGRILRAALWAKLGIVPATKISAKTGSVFGWILIGLGLVFTLSGNLVGGLWWVLIGAFIRFAAKTSLQHFLTTRILSRANVQKMMSPNPPSITSETPISEFVDEHIYNKGAGIYPVGQNGRLMGLVDIESIRQIPRSQWEERTIGDLAEAFSKDSQIDHGADAGQALEQLLRSKRRGLFVTRNGTIEGIVSLEDLERYIQRNSSFNHQQPLQ